MAQRGKKWPVFVSTRVASEECGSRSRRWSGNLVTVRSRALTKVVASPLVAVSLALVFLMITPASSSAASTNNSVSPIWAVSIAMQTAESSDDLAAATPALGLSDLRVKVKETEIELQVAKLEKQTDDRKLAASKLAVEELNVEAAEIADSTVQSALTNYQSTEFDAGPADLDDINEALRANELGDAAILADTETFDAYRDKVKDLEIAQATLAARQAQNDTMSSYIAEVQTNYATDSARLADLEEARFQQVAVEESVAATTWAQSRGRKVGFYLFTCPVNGKHDFIDSWGFPRSGGRKHKGVDIMAKTGVEIVAPVSGRVEHRSNRVGGRSFHLWGADGNYYYGTHLSAYGKSGEVNAGEVIGYVGDDGNAAGLPHLHFEIHAGGRGNQINPFIDSAAVCDGAIY